MNNSAVLLLVPFYCLISLSLPLHTHLHTDLYNHVSPRKAVISCFFHSLPRSFSSIQPSKPSGGAHLTSLFFIWVDMPHPLFSSRPPPPTSSNNPPQPPVPIPSLLPENISTLLWILKKICKIVNQPETLKIIGAGSAHVPSFLMTNTARPNQNMEFFIKCASTVT